MSTIASTERLDARTVEGPGLGFGRLLRVELRKNVDTRGGRGLMIAIAVITALVVAAVMWFARKDGAGYGAFVAATATPQSLLIPALGIITACNEWSQRTALITFTQEPRRWRVLLAKTLAAVIWATLFLLLAWGLAAVFHMITAAISGTPMNWDMEAKDFLGGWINQCMGVLMGVGMGMLLLITPLALAAYYVGPQIIAGLLMIAKSTRKLVPWISQTTVPIGTEPLLEGMPVETNQWGKWATTMLVWFVVPYAVGFWRVLRREVK